MSPAQRELARLLALMLVAEVRKSVEGQAAAGPTVESPSGSDRLAAAVAHQGVKRRGRA